MKKVSAKMFFTVLWRGLCQALGWFFGLFGYKRNGKFAKCVWGVFALSSTIIVAVLATAACIGAYEGLKSWYNRHYVTCLDPYSYPNIYVSRGIYFHKQGRDKGFIYNVNTKEKLLDNVAWFANPKGQDSLVCFSNGKKRGYFNMFTGKVVIEPKYNHAWVFSEGLACVEEGGYFKFIDNTGKVVIDMKMPYNPNLEGYVFHGGYCMVDDYKGKLYGLMDKEGNLVLPKEYDEIEPTDDYELWCVTKGKEAAVLDKDLNPVVPLMESSMYISEGFINVTMPDHTMRKYDLQGNLINDFYINGIRTLEYEKNEIQQRIITHNNADEEYITPMVVDYKPKAIARLKAYTVGYYEGLITADGHVVTLPLYRDIEALDHDLYLCTSIEDDMVIVNGKGEIVK